MAGLVIALLGLAACSAMPHAASGGIELEHVPFFPQEEYHCGPAALATLLAASGVSVTPEQLAPAVYIPGRQGSLQAELVAAARRHARLAWVIEPRVEALVAQLDAGRPVLVLQNFGSASSPLWHYAVVIGYEPGQQAFLLRSGVTERQRLPARRFVATWARGDFWALTVRTPGDIPDDATADRYLRAASGLETSGQSGAAAQAYEAATRRWPDAPNTWFALAGLRLARGQLRDGEALYQRVIDLAPDHAAARNNLAVLLARRGCPAAAAAQLMRARRSATSAMAGTLDDTAAELASLKDQTPDAKDCPAPGAP